MNLNELQLDDYFVLKLLQHSYYYSKIAENNTQKNRFLKGLLYKWHVYEK